MNKPLPLNRTSPILTIFKKLILLFALTVSLSEKGASEIIPLAYVVPYGETMVSSVSEPGPYGGYLWRDTNNVGFFTVGRYWVAPTEEEDLELLNSSMTVYLSVGGTADPIYPGDVNNCPQVGDYAFGGAVNPDYPTEFPELINAGGRYSVVIPAGETQISFKIFPVLDYACEPTETIDISVLPSAAYNSTNDIATVEIYDTDTALSWHNLPGSKRVYQGETFTFLIHRECGSTYGTALWGTPITNSWHLMGTATYGVDYTIDSSPNHTVFDSQLYVTIPYSNQWVEIQFTALSTNSFVGFKTVNLVPPDFLQSYFSCPSYPRYADIVILAAGTPYLHSETVNTNGAFQFLVTAPTTNLCYISASTNLVDWTNIGSLFMTNNTNAFIDSQTSNFVNRFYRVYYSP